MRRPRKRNYHVEVTPEGEDFELEDITEWHVQGKNKQAIEEMLQILGDAN